MTIDEAIDEFSVYLNEECYAGVPRNEAMKLAMLALLAMEHFIEGAKRNKMDLEG